jgi:hypothetical protein
VLGDKLYDKPDDPAWQDSLARTIAWCLDHDAMVYNHFYTHPRLDLTRPEHITWEAAVNDRYLRKLLTNIGRQDLISRLGNMIALPFDVWPSTAVGKKILLAYKNPEGMPLQAIFEIDFIYRPKFMLPPYSPQFDRFHIPRIVATNGAIDYLEKNQDKFEKAQVCALNGLEAQRLEDETYLSDQIQQALQQNTCPPGIYVVQGRVYQAQPSGVSAIFPLR